jgi:hypothetical protein
VGVDASESFGSSTGGEGNSVLQRRLDLGGFDDSGESRGLGLGDRSSSEFGVRSGDGLKRSSGLGGNGNLDGRRGFADGGLDGSGLGGSGLGSSGLGSNRSRSEGHPVATSSRRLDGSRRGDDGRLQASPFRSSRDDGGGSGFRRCDRSSLSDNPVDSGRRSNLDLDPDRFLLDDGRLLEGGSRKNKRIQLERDVHDVLDGLDELFRLVVVDQDLIDLVQRNVGEKRRVVVVTIDSIATGNKGVGVSDCLKGKQTGSTTRPKDRITYFPTSLSQSSSSSSSSSSPSYSG